MWGLGSARGLEGQLEAKTFDLLEVGYHLEQVARLRVAAGAQHAHEAFGRRFVRRLSSSKPIVALM